ncbi:exosortase E/protease, VPEID-CTERM system [Alloyangia pacifica]|uniref:exosortase E/protease, VPEID-CTERM system n=1 Tax=Alloyangia pacifica TaxID=311180 RepID=UPI002671F3F3|nr:exosortase E/protease, VPEID-CTERM system [Alloyangia pacifica]
MRRLTALAHGPRRAPAPAALGLLLAAELLVISLAYQHGFPFTCREQAPSWFCAFAGRMVPRAIGALAALGLFALARRDVLGALMARGASPRGRALAVNLAGLALVLAPWTFLSDAAGPRITALALLSWCSGGVLSTVGLALQLAPRPAWAALLRQHAGSLAALLALGLAAPELADLLQPLWRIEAVTGATFAAVVRTLGVFGYEVLAEPAEKLIGTPGFVIAVGPQCAGVEGIVLVALFTTLFLLLFRRELRFPHVLALYPLGFALSWGLNVLRIAALLAIGLDGHPELAVGGFHSHAGWVAFTGLALLLILVARHLPVLHRPARPSPGAARPPPLLADPQVARLLPFAVMMGSALVASTLSQTPAHLYPWRALAMAAALALVLPTLRGLIRRPDPRALAVGGFIAALWITTGPEAGAPPQGTLAGAALGLWIGSRLLGSTLLVPVIEELVFRDYLLRRLAPRPVLAAALSCLAFAALHERWLVAGLAGLALCLLRHRRGEVSDAIAAHMVANGCIGLWAWTTGAWHIL